MTLDRSSIGNTQENVLAELLLLLEAERAVIGRDDLQIVELQSAPNLVLIPLLPDGRSHHPLRAFESRLLVHAVIEEEILRTCLGVRRRSLVASAHDLIE